MERYEGIRLCDVEDVLAEDMEDLLPEMAYDIVPLDDGDCRMELDGIRVYIPELDWLLRTGTVAMLNKSTKEFEPDFSITAIYEGRDARSEDWLYYEQDGMLTTIHNYLAAIQSDVLGREDDLKCNILVSDDTPDEDGAS